MSNPKLIAKTQQAVSLFQAGQYEQAQTLLEKVCSKDKKNDLAWFLLATIFFQNGNLKKAEQLYLQAVSANANYAEAWNNIGVIRERLQNFDEAGRAYKKAIKCNPQYTSALFHLGNLHQQSQHFDEAKTLYTKVLSLDPNHLKTLINLSLILEQNKEYTNALSLLYRALELNPTDIEALNNIGFILRAQEQHEEAVEYFTRAIELQEDSSKSHSNLGASHLELEQFDAAKRAFLRAIEIDPMNVEAITNLAVCYEQTDHPEKAIKEYERAIRIDGNHMPALNGLGALLKLQGKADDAYDIFERANKIDPTFADTRYNLATTQLGMGKFSVGFKNYTSRPSRLSLNFNTSIETLDMDLTGKQVLLIKDQGIGDEIFFLRFAPQLKQRGATVSYLASEKARPLLERVSYIDNLYDEENKSIKADIYLSVADLPHVLEIQDDQTLPAPITLAKPEEQVADLKAQLKALGPPPYIGLTWRGGTRKKHMLYKEIELDKLAAAVKDIEGTFIALQRLPEDNEINDISNHLGKKIHDFTGFNEKLDQMMGLLFLLDEYIGVSNTNMHLRASLGRTCRVLVPHPPEWRWMTGGKTSPWFPGFSVYRQESDGNWDKALNMLQEDLSAQDYRSATP